jgi:hypothetical protein
MQNASNDKGTAKLHTLSSMQFFNHVELHRFDAARPVESPWGYLSKSSCSASDDARPRRRQWC